MPILILSGSGTGNRAQMRRWPPFVPPLTAVMSTRTFSIHGERHGSIAWSNAWTRIFLRAFVAWSNKASGILLADRRFNLTRTCQPPSGGNASSFTGSATFWSVLGFVRPLLIMSIHSVIQQHYRIYLKWRALWDMCSIVPPHYRSNCQPICFAGVVLAGAEYWGWGLCPPSSPFG